jgi:hypothetical protein
MSCTSFWNDDLSEFKVSPDGNIPLFRLLASVRRLCLTFAISFGESGGLFGVALFC